MTAEPTKTMKWNAMQRRSTNTNTKSKSTLLASIELWA
jgi:hypothetical protein